MQDVRIKPKEWFIPTYKGIQAVGIDRKMDHLLQNILAEENRQREIKKMDKLIHKLIKY